MKKVDVVVKHYELCKKLSLLMPMVQQAEDNPTKESFIRIKRNYLECIPLMESVMEEISPINTNVSILKLLKDELNIKRKGKRISKKGLPTPK